MADPTSLLGPERWPALAAALAPWLTAQRWFAGKARQVTGCTVADVGVLDDTVAIVLVDVAYADGGAERYQVPLAPGEPAVAVVDGLSLADGLRVPDAVRTLATAAVRGGAATTAGGATVRGTPVGRPVTADLGRSRALGVEQSNTSVVLDDALIMKVFRRVEAGVQPEVEVTRALTEAGFPHVPAQAGALALEGADHGDGATSLAVVAGFLGRAREGWDLALAEARGVLAGGVQPRLAPAVDDLGQVVGRMHVALRDALGAEEASPDDADAWSRAMEAQACRVLDLAAARDPAGTAAVVARRDALLARFAGLADLGDLGLLVRTHGDLHLGQVLLDEEDGWQILDFEGEPARPLAERRTRQTPLRDVAGVLRSFDYAAASAALDPPPQLAAWRDDLRRAFLDGYRSVAGPAGLVPDAAWPALLAAFELDKAVYELGYELANRPTWVAIPVAGILRVLGAAPATADPT